MNHSHLPWSNPRITSLCVPLNQRQDSETLLKEAVKLLIEYRRTFPAFRTMTVGAPHSMARQQQYDHISLENQTDKFIQKVEATK